MSRTLPNRAGASTGRRAELETLLREYAEACRPGSDERARLEGWPELRRQARQTWVLLMDSFRSGQDVSEAALWQLLPYKVTPLARSRGAFCHPAAAFRDDPRSRFAGAGWLEEDDWPRIGRGLFEFVLRCDDYPPDLWQACEAFAALQGGRAFTSGMLSPILNALRPDEFVLVNAAGRAVLNHFEGCSLTTALTDYSTANKAAHELIASLAPRLKAAPFEGIHPADVFEGWCHWIVNTRMHPVEDAGADDPHGESSGLAVFPTSLLGMRPLKSELPPTPTVDDTEIAPEPAAAEPAAAAPEPAAPAPAPEPAAPAAAGSGQGLAVGLEPANDTGAEGREAPGTRELSDLHEADDATRSELGDEDDMELLEPALIDERDEAGPADPHAAEESLMARCLAALDRKGQIVLHGPPGCGKGRLARRLAARLVEGGDGLRGHIAFHASWTYADFIQQQLPDGQRRLGRFAAFCRKAAGRRGCSVLVIEDMQRARVAEVLGEALVLLEQRGSELTLAGGGNLVIPPRVRLIATVDSSQDQGVLTDPVLRQRFAFVPVEPPPDAAR